MSSPESKKYRYVCEVFSLTALLCVSAAAVLAQSSADLLQKRVADTLDIRRETQQKEDRWEEEKATLQERYRSARARVDALARRKERLEAEVGQLQGQVDELDRRMAESGRLEAGLEEVMASLFARLREWVARDLPFLPEERSMRLEDLAQTLARPEDPPAEKLRRLLEALQVECEYGDTVEVYQQQIEVEGRQVLADILRLGRLSVFWQTPDQKRAGEYDRAAGKWVELPPRDRRSIQTAMEIAGKRRPVELVKLPLGRINP